MNKDLARRAVRDFANRHFSPGSSSLASRLIAQPQGAELFDLAAVADLGGRCCSSRS
jgi:hypothetical protein